MPTPREGYRLADGTKVPGVTTVIGQLGWSKSALMYWAWSQGRDGHDFRDTSKKAADIGTVAHALIEAEVLGPGHAVPKYPIDLISAALPALEAYKRWAKDTHCTIVATEAQLVSEHHRYGGTIDAIAAISGRLQILDFKTSKAVYGDYLIQLAAYQRLWNECNPTEQLEPGGVILRCGKDGSFASHSYPQHVLDLAWEAFLLARRLYDLKRPLEEAA